MRGLRDNLFDLAAGFERQASQVMGENADVYRPDPDAEWGRLLIKCHALKALAGSLENDPYPGFLAAVRHAQTASVSTRKQNDNYRLLKVLETLAFYVFNGENSI